MSGRPEGRPDGGPLEEGRDPEEDGRTFEELLGELEEVTDRLAGGDLGIEAAADLYERAERLHALASARLDQVRGRVDRLRSDPQAPPG